MLCIWGSEIQPTLSSLEATAFSVHYLQPLFPFSTYLWLLFIEIGSHSEAQSDLRLKILLPGLSSAEIIQCSIIAHPTVWKCFESCAYVFMRACWH